MYHGKETYLKNTRGNNWRYSPHEMNSLTGLFGDKPNHHFLLKNTTNLCKKIV